MAADIFQAVPQDEIPKLLKLFKEDWTKYYPLNQYVTIMKEYKDAKIDVSKKALYRYGTAEKGVYLYEATFPRGGTPFTSFFIFTASEELSDMKKALLETSQIPWTLRGYIFEITIERFQKVISEVALTKGVEFDMKENFMMWLPEPVPCGILPDEMYLDYLAQRHISEINENWPHRFADSETYLLQQLSVNFGLGLFRKSDNKMVSSALSFHSGGIFVLFTYPEFRGKGYADIIVRNMATELHKRGRIPFATIITENIPSQKLFSKIGFKHFSKVYFMLRR